MKRFVIWWVILLSLCSFTVSAAEPERKKATVMVYMCGSSLEMPPIYKEASSAIEKIRSADFDSDEVNVVALIGGTRFWAEGRYDSSVLTLLTFGESPTEESQPLAPMNDPETLSGFLKTCSELYPAEHYILIIWDHGGGPNMGVCQDQLFLSGGSDDLENSFLTVPELAEAFRDSPFAESKLDLLVFSCCLMSSAELSAELAPYVKYLAATEDQMYGLSYDWLSGIGEDPDILSTAKRLTDSSYQYNEEVIQKQGAAELNSFSVIDLEKTDELIEAIDEYFVYIGDHMDETTYNALSGYRRETASFGKSYRAENDFDLVDLGDFARHSRQFAPEAAEQLLSAIGDSVVYHRGSSNSVSGLTIYHPFQNKVRLKKWMQIHNALGFSGSYSSYLNHFVSYLTGTPLADWADLVTKTADMDKAVRTLFTLELDEDQLLQYGEGKFMILHKHDDAGYSFTYASDASVKDNGLSGEFIRSTLYAFDNGSGERLTEELEFAVDENGFYQIPAVLQRDELNSGIPVILTCEKDHFGELIPREVMLWEESLGTYRSVPDVSLADFHQIILSTVLRTETRDANGTLLPFDEWETAEVREWKIDLQSGSNWAFVLSDQVPPHQELCALFEITDAQNNRYCSEPLSIRNPGSPEIPVTYDDSGLVLITANPKITQRNDIMEMALSVRNISDRETVIGIRNIIVNGMAVEGEYKTWGNGPNDGQEPGEEQILYISLSLPAETDVFPVTDLRFDLFREDPETGEILMTIPVSNDPGL